MFSKYLFSGWNRKKASTPATNSKLMDKKIRLGICAMDKKAKSKPMCEILGRLPKDLFEIEIFGDDCILNKPPDTWPVVEILITFYSTRFPTEKAIEYIKLRKPFLINDLETDNTILKDRRKVYNLLESVGIDVPIHVFVNRDEGKNDHNIEEFDEVFDIFLEFFLFFLLFLTFSSF
jgi:inositol hexakisphosphate/diphosphoinositol-pentakisphosphate kinase